MPVQFPPGALDFVRLSVYLEALLDNVELLPRAQFDFQMRVADLLDDVETQSRQAKLTNGAGLIQPTP